MDFDIIVVGGSYAGLAATMQAARARRKILVIDAGQRRNRFADSAHGFLTQDGKNPAEIAETAKAQVLAYPTMRWKNGFADKAEKLDGGFAVTVGAERFTSKRLVLASGARDELPAIAGLEERWGKSVFHCPYCHGYEINQGRIGLFGTSANCFHLAMLLPDWGKVTLLLAEGVELATEPLEKLERRGVAIERRAVSGIEGKADVRLADGTLLNFDGLFATPRMVQNNSIAEQLGCAIEETPMGLLVTTDAMKETNVPGVYACGDMALMGGSVSLAVGSGAIAGAAVHQSLVFRE